MCGIAGAIGVFREEQLQAMLRSMIHRGPDDGGIHASRDVLLGSRRLSIIDVAGGHQPVSNEAGDVTVVLNGEIYNHVELHDRLAAKGHHFRTRSDTEVIAHGYEEWGLEVAGRLRGMFAFAIHDARQGRDRLVLARDRIGIKPLYMASLPEGTLFASEVRALLASGRVPRQLSRAGVSSFLHFGAVSEPDTLIEGLISLPPGHAVVFDEERAPAMHRGWSLPTPATHRMTAASATAEVRAALDDAVRAHMVADVDVGLFLSSGVDSTIVASLAAEQGFPLATITVGFKEAGSSEADEARRTAERLGTKHTERIVSVEDARRALPDILRAMDQPTIDGVNTWVVSREARRVGLKVALTGLGGDEVFGGYDSFRSVPWMARADPALARIPRALRRGVARAALGDGSAARRKLAAFVSDPRGLPHAYFYARLLFTPGQVASLTPGMPGAHAWLSRAHEDASQARGMPAFHATSYLEIRHYMLNTLLRDSDVFSMANSLEVRPPLLDHALVEKVFQLPARILRGPRPKEMLRRACAAHLRGRVATQRKRTFTFPWESWLRGPLATTLQEELQDLPPSLDGVLARGHVERVCEDFERGRTTWSRPWSLYVLSSWARAHLDPTFRSDDP